MFTPERISNNLPREEFDQRFMDIWTRLKFENQAHFFPLAQELSRTGRLDYSSNGFNFRYSLTEEFIHCEIDVDELVIFERRSNYSKSQNATIASLITELALNETSTYVID
jgi:hypothetical protein